MRIIFIVRLSYKYRHIRNSPEIYSNCSKTKGANTLRFAIYPVSRLDADDFYKRSIQSANRFRGGHLLPRRRTSNYGIGI